MVVILSRSEGSLVSERDPSLRLRMTNKVKDDRARHMMTEESDQRVAKPTGERQALTKAFIML